MNWYKTYITSSVEEKDIPQSTMWKRWDGVTKGEALVEVIKNPSRNDIAKIRRQQSYGSEIGMIVTVNNTYAFRRDLEFHKNIANKLGLTEYIGILLGNNYAMVTDATSDNFRDNPEVASIVKKMLPQVTDVSYFNEAIVGDWEELVKEANGLNWYKTATKGIRINEEIEKAVDLSLGGIFETCLKVQKEFKLGQGTYTPFPLSFIDPINNEEVTMGVYVKKSRVAKVYYYNRVVTIEISSKPFLNKWLLKKSLLHEIVHRVDPTTPHNYVDKRNRISLPKYYSDSTEINAVQSTLLYAIQKALESGKISPSEIENYLRANSKTVPKVSISIPGVSGGEMRFLNYWRNKNPEAYRLFKERLFRLLEDFKSKKENDII